MTLNNLMDILLISDFFSTLRLVYLYLFRVNCMPQRYSRGVPPLHITFLILLVYLVYSVY